MIPYFSIPVLLLAATVGAQETTIAAAPEGDAGATRFLSSVRRLTYEGRRAGEGYFSADGRRLVFQSEREPGNPFFQIYELDLESGDTRRLSPGLGKTTCAFPRPGGREVLFSSTHLDPASARLQEEELAARTAGQERRYAWDYDEHMDIFVSDGGDAPLRRLTDSRGYDAEASYSPDGAWIVFASNRHAWEEPLTPADRERLEIDPSWFVDLYRMRADGSDVQRLTDAPGYDGGPFFMPDGRGIVWRRFDDSGARAEIWRANADGSQARPITSLGAMSWGPYAHPSGAYILFSTNLQGFDNFEIYMVDADGEREPVRVTFSEGFDGLPVPSPDGRRLAWTSTRHGGDGGQIYLADWDHEAALAALAAAPRRSGSTGASPAREDEAAGPEATQSRLRTWVGALTAEELEGRATGTPGGEAAAALLERELRALGALPLPGQDGFRIPFEFTAGTRDGGSNLSLVEPSGEVPGMSWRGSEHVLALSFSDAGTVRAPAVFAGYGLVVPEGESTIYDSYAGLEVEGRIVVVLRYSPEDTTGDLRSRLARYAGLRYKALQARERGAVGMVVVTGPRSPRPGRVVPLQFDAAVADSGLPAVSVDGEVAAEIFACAGRDLAAVQQELDGGNPHVTGFALGCELEIEAILEREKRRAHNVAGYLPGAGAAAADEAWVGLGAHYDHLGRGRSESSLADASEATAIHPGADDNASGVAAVLEAGRQLAAGSHRRNIGLLFWAGEELGTLGSTAFLDEAVLDPATIAAYVNLDMVGRLEDGSLSLQATGSSPAWAGIIERANVAAGLPVQLGEDPYLPTDSVVFHGAAVPTLNLFTGSHEDYHKPSDTADKLDYAGLERVAGLAARITARLADLESAPEYVAAAPGRRSPAGDRDTLRAFTGTIPDYATEVDGLRLAGVVEGGPAQAAGLAAGDIIIEFAGTGIANIYDYTYALDAVRIGQPVVVIYLRDGERHEATITPTARGGG